VARKNVLSYAMLLDADAAVSVTSPITNVLNLDKASIHLSWVGTAIDAIVVVQVRNSAKDEWYNLDFGSTIEISGNSGDHQLIFNEMPFVDMRLYYEAYSGTGTFDAILTAKQVGG